jgi:SAM-dependent methyltransferase
MNRYRRRIFLEMRSTLESIGPLNSVLDVGSGDGWFAMSVGSLGICEKIAAVDVKKRPHCFHPVELYDGERLPFHDQEFDLVYAVDVVHHAPEPAKLLGEMIRCARRFVLLKDHTWQTAFGRLALVVRDELGNRPKGVRCVYNFQHGWEWDGVMLANGMERVQLKYPLYCHAGPLGGFANNNEFLSVWQPSEPLRDGRG